MKDTNSTNKDVLVLESLSKLDFPSCNCQRNLKYCLCKNSGNTFIEPLGKFEKLNIYFETVNHIRTRNYIGADYSDTLIELIYTYGKANENKTNLYLIHEMIKKEVLKFLIKDYARNQFNRKVRSS